MKKMLTLAATCAAAFMSVADDAPATDAPAAESAVVLSEDCGAPATRVLPFAFEICSVRPNEDTICGARLNLFGGRDKYVSFLDIGPLTCLVDEEALGLQVAGLYSHIGRSSGLFQIAGLCNRVDGDAYGLQVASLYNAIDGSLGGMNLAVINSAGSALGLQIGVVNRAKTLAGLQIGVVNYAEDGSEGVQIGVVNIMRDGLYPVCPVLNIGF